MNRRQLFSACLTFLMAACLCPSVRADAGRESHLDLLGDLHAGYDNLIVFGDSLSDTGEMYAVTGQAIPPEPFYDQGRFSNGPVWVEYLADGLGISGPTPAETGGTNYAYGGAQTQDTPGVTPGVPFIDMDEQVAAYLSGGSSSAANSLFVVWGGANDLLLGEPTGQDDQRVPRDPTVSAANIEQRISDLYDSGARDFLVPNLPPVGEIPAITDPTAKAGLDALSVAFNQALDADLDALEAAHHDINIHRMDVASFTQQVLADPEAYGFTNVTDAAVPGLSVVTGTFPDPNSDWQPDDPDSYLFWDDTHLTTAFQKLLGDLALETLSTQVPEPTTLALLAMGGVPLLMRRRRPG